MMMDNVMSLLLRAAEQFKNGLMWQQGVGTLVQSELIVTLNVGDQMMKGSAILNAQVFGSAFLQEIVTHVPSLQIAQLNAGEQTKWDSVMYQ
jgi:hypothetical protein